MISPKPRAWMVTVLTLGVALSIAGGCDQADDAVSTCAGTAIPAHGCPTDQDDEECADTCDCAAAYDCVGGAWSLAFTCPNFDPDASTCARPAGADAGAASVSPDGGACRDLSLPAGATADQGAGCIQLQDDDCAVGEVACNPAACVEFGCGALFYCLDGNWYPWGECADGGVVQTH